MQRRIERAIRKQKNRILVDEAAGDKDKLLSDQIRLQRYRQEYVRFSKAAGLRTQNERAQVAGFGRKQAAEAMVETDKQLKIILENAKNGDKITLSEDMENIIAQKDYSDILPLREKLSDRAARKWYLAQDSRIPSLIDRSLSIEDQARQAFALRNQNRTNARNLMRDQKKRMELDKLEPNWLFEDLVADKMRRKSLSREQALEDIINSATKTRKSVNKQLGLG